jgi:nucleoid DNA-binding protein
MAKKKKKVSAKVKTKAKSSAKATKRTKTKGTKKNTARKTSTTVSTGVRKEALNKLVKAVKKARTKSDIMGVIAASSGLAKKEVASVFDNIQELINFDLGKNGPGVFNFPGLMKIVKVTKPATKARKGVNPFTKEPMMFKAKPAHSVVKVRALKGLKEMVR